MRDIPNATAVIPVAIPATRNQVTIKTRVKSTGCEAEKLLNLFTSFAPRCVIEHLANVIQIGINS